MRAAFLCAMVGALLLTLGWAGRDAVGVPGAVRAATETATIRWGPYSVPAAGGGAPGSTQNQLDLNVEKPCADCYITGIAPNLVYGDGTTVNFSTGGMLHHMVLFNVGAPDATCDAGTLIGSIGERVFASGNERSVTTLPDGYGYYIAPGDTWTLIIDIMNFQPFSQDMYLEFDFAYRPGADSVNPVTPVWLDVDNCADSEYSIPAGDSDTHWDWVSGLEGDIVAIGGHVHDYGISVSAEDVGGGQYLCTSVAGYAAGSSFAPPPVPPGDAGHPGAANVIDPGDPAYMGHIEDMSACATGHHVYVGDTIRLHTRHNAPAARDDVMGIMVAYVHETTALPDHDGDGVPDASDNCPAWPNPGQGLPPWPVAADDPDCDGYDSAVETFVNTYYDIACPATSDGEDEDPDPWPPDLNDDRVVNILDVVHLTPPAFNTSPPDPGYSARKDLTADGTVNILDIVLVTPPMFNSVCS